MSVRELFGWCGTGNLKSHALAKTTMRPKPVDGSSGDHIDLAAPQRLNHCQRYFFGFSFESRDWSAGICRLAGRKYGQSSRALGPRATVSIILYIQAMTRIRAREAVVAEFLRNALAVEPLGVPKLDAMARAWDCSGKVSASRKPNHSGEQRTLSVFGPFGRASG